MLSRLGSISVPIQRLLLIAGCVLLFVVRILPAPLTEIDETRYTEATRMMLKSGDFMIPQFNGAPRYQKPVLIYWLMAGPMALSGGQEWSARIPSAVFSLFSVLLIYTFLLRWLAPPGLEEDRKRRGLGAAFLGAAAFALMPLTAVWSRFAVTDPTLSFFIIATSIALLQAEMVETTGTESSRKWYLWAAAAAGFAFLTKGPVGVVLPALAWVPYHLSRRSLGATARRMPWLWGIGLFLLITVPWYATTYFVDGPGFLTHFFLNENLGRFAATQEDHGSGNRLLNLFLTPAYALLLLFPFTPALISELIKPIKSDALSADPDVVVRLRRYAWLWLGITVVFFSLSKTQLPSYIQTIAAPAALLVSLYLLDHDGVRDRSLRARWAGGIEFGLWLLLGLGYIGGILYVLRQGQLAGPLGALPFPARPAYITMVLFAAAGLLFFVNLLRPARDPRLGRVMGAWAGVLAVLLIGVAPLVITSMFGTSRAVGLAIRDLRPDLQAILFTGSTSESVIFYARRTLEMYPSDEEDSVTDCLRSLRTQTHALLIVDANGRKALQPVADFDEITRVGKITIGVATWHAAAP